MAATITPTDLNARHSPSGGGHRRYTAAQRTIGVGCKLMKTNKNGFSSYIFLGCARGATGKLRVRARARVQTGLLYIELLVCACGARATKTKEDRPIRARDLFPKKSIENLWFQKRTSSLFHEKHIFCRNSKCDRLGFPSGEVPTSFEPHKNRVVLNMHTGTDT